MSSVQPRAAITFGGTTLAHNVEVLAILAPLQLGRLVDALGSGVEAPLCASLCVQ